MGRCRSIFSVSLVHCIICTIRSIFIFFFFSTQLLFVFLLLDILLYVCDFNDFAKWFSVVLYCTLKKSFFGTIQLLQSVDLHAHTSIWLIFHTDETRIMCTVFFSPVHFFCRHGIVNSYAGCLLAFLTSDVVRIIFTVCTCTRYVTSCKLFCFNNNFCSLTFILQVLNDVYAMCMYHTHT